MNSTDLFTTLGTACKRYGPGRLPRAERRDIGAGYALASAATGTTLLFALMSWGLYILGEPIGSDWDFLGTWALVALPFVVPTSFVSAVIVWRSLPSDTPYFGASAGVLAALGTYALVLLTLFVFSIITITINGQYAEIPDALGFMTVVGFVALASTFWLTFPVGAISGIIHERVALYESK